MQRVGKCFLGVETPLFALVMVQPHQVEEEEEVAVPNAPTPPSPTIAPSSPPQDPTPTSYATPHASPPQKQPSLAHDSTMSLLYPKRGKIEAIDADEDITLVDVEKDEEDVSAAEPTVFDDEEVTMTMAQTMIKM
nr:hypothetical protein [Tanacetum cinerariifolium]